MWAKSLWVTLGAQCPLRVLIRLQAEWETRRDAGRGWGQAAGTEAGPSVLSSAEVVVTTPARSSLQCQPRAQSHGPLWGMASLVRDWWHSDGDQVMTDDQWSWQWWYGDKRAVMVVTAESLESRDRGCTGQGPLWVALPPSSCAATRVQSPGPGCTGVTGTSPLSAHHAAKPRVGGPGHKHSLTDLKHKLSQVMARKWRVRD